jgi:sulfate transport system ATP-binding protein
MSNGKIEQVDSPVALYAKPNSRFVFDFLGNVNIYQANLANKQWANGDAFILPPDIAATQQDGQLYVRSHELTISNKANSQASLPFEIASINPVGAEVRVELKPDGWQSDEIWEAKLTHSSLQDKSIVRGAKVFGTPQVGYFFGKDGSPSPTVLRWPFLAEGNVNFEI